MSPNNNNTGDANANAVPDDDRAPFSMARFAKYFVAQPDVFRPAHTMPKPAPDPAESVGYVPEQFDGTYHHPDDSDYDEDILFSPLMSPARAADEADCTTTTRGRILPGTDFDAHLVFPDYPDRNEQTINRALERRAERAKRAKEEELLEAPTRGDKLWIGFYTGLELRDVENMKELGERRELTADERKRREEMKKLHKRTCRSPLREKRHYEWRTEMKNKRHTGGPKDLAAVNAPPSNGRDGELQDGPTYDAFVKGVDYRKRGVKEHDSHRGESEQRSPSNSFRDNSEDGYISDYKPASVSPQVRGRRGRVVATYPSDSEDASPPPQVRGRRGRRGRAIRIESSAEPSSRSLTRSVAPSPADRDVDVDVDMDVDMDMDMDMDMEDGSEEGEVVFHGRRATRQTKTASYVDPTLPKSDGRQ